MKTTFIKDIDINNLIKIIAACLLTSLSVTSYAQSIKTAISQEMTSNVKFLNLESEKYFVHDAEYLDGEPMKFAHNGEDIMMKDITSDGIKDAVVLLFYCEETSCHTTTHSTDLVIFKGLRNNQFVKLGAASLGVNAKIESVNNGIINVTSYGYGEDDPGCCPTEEVSRSFKIKNDKLAEIQ